MEGIDLPEGAIVASMVDIVPVAMHHATVHVRLFACEVRICPIAVEGRDFRYSHPVDEAVTCLQVSRTRSDNKVARAGRLPDYRLAVGKAAQTPERVWCKSKVMFDDIRIDPTHDSALIAFGIGSWSLLAAWLFPDVLLALQCWRQIHGGAVYGRGIFSD